MADSIWRAGHRLDESLCHAAYEFEFFQAVRLLLLSAPETDTVKTHAVSNVLRFKAHSSMSFPPSPVVKIARAKRQDSGNGEESKPWQTVEEEHSHDERELPLEMTVAFLGLLGPSRTLPDSYTEFALRQRAFGDDSFAAFFDIFHHRLLALYYRAWEKHQFAVGQEQARHGKDAVTRYLLDLIGMGTAGLQSRLPFSDSMLLRYAGLLAQRPRSAECLRALLGDYLGVGVAIEQFCGRWHVLDDDEMTVLGSGALNSQLGEGAAAGDMVWNLQSLIRVVLGPLSAEEFFQFIPEGSRFEELSALVRWYLGPGIDFELQPVLAQCVVPTWGALGRVSWQDGGRTMRLGWSGWLTADAFTEPAADAIFAESELVRWEA